MIPPRAPADALTPAAHGAKLILNLVVRFLATVTLVVVNPPVYSEEEAIFSLDRVQDAALVHVVSLILSLFVLGPLFSTALSSVDASKRAAALRALLLMDSLLALLSIAIGLLPLWVDDIPFEPASLILYFAISLLLSWTTTEPLALLARYYAAGNKAVFVLSGGNGGVVGTAAVVPASTPKTSPTKPAVSDASTSSSSSLSTELSLLASSDDAFDLEAPCEHAIITEINPSDF